MPDENTGLPPGSARGILRLIAPEFIRRVVAGIGFPLRGEARPPIQGADLGSLGTETNQPMPRVRREPFFGPGQPLTPVVADRTEVEGRATDYPFALNQNYRPRSSEPISFEILRRMADPTTGYDLMRLAIETRKDQMAKLEWSILPRQEGAKKRFRKATPRCAEIERCLRSPDRRLPWESWMRELIEDQLVIDAPAVFVRKTVGGDLYSLDVVDGATIKVLVDGTGRAPMPPEPAYQQVLKGVVVANYTADELIYMPRNPRSSRFYGMSPVEQVLMTVNIGLRRQLSQLDYYTAGNMPDSIISVPETWTPAQIKEFQTYWDAMIEGNPSLRRRAKFVPAGINPVMTGASAGTGLMDQYDEWLARVIMYAFSLPALPFIRMQNRATAETANASALEEGLLPMMAWLKGLMDRIIEVAFNEPGLEFVFDSIRKLDQAEQLSMDLQMMERGIKSLDEVREELGLEPLGLPHIRIGIGPLGFMTVEDMKKAIAQGLTMPQAPPAVDAMGNPIPGGAPGAGISGQTAAQVLEQLPPGLRNFVDGALTPRAMIRAEALVDEEESDPPSGTMAAFMHQAIDEASQLARGS